MDIEKLADRLACYNEWRRGMDGKQPHPVELGADIDDAVSALREIARLRAELESARVDAERYRYLKDIGVFRVLSLDMSGKHTWTLVGRPIRGEGSTIDVAIDAARGGK